MNLIWIILSRYVQLNKQIQFETTDFYYQLTQKTIKTLIYLYLTISRKTTISKRK